MPTKMNTIAEPVEQEYIPMTDDEVAVVEDWRVKAYDPKDETMNPGSPKWNPREYFARQPKDIIVINRTQSDMFDDPTGNRTITIPVSINTYILNVPKGRPVKVPRDFATALVRIGAAYSQGTVEQIESM